MKKMIFAMTIAAGVMTASFANAQTEKKASKPAKAPKTEEKQVEPKQKPAAGETAKPTSAAKPAQVKVKDATATKKTKAPKPKTSEAKMDK
jgi:Ni/Co efflux regulator RcnB